MRNAFVIMNRDLKSYFATMMAYAIGTIFFLIAGYFFFNFVFLYGRLSFHMGSDPNFATGLDGMEIVLRPLLMNLSIILLFVIPILTMRSFSEEKKQGTIELLFTYPVTNLEILLGKFFAATGVFLLYIALTVSYIVLLTFFGQSFPANEILVAYSGVILLGMSFISLGLFTSSITENQTVAAILSYGILLLFWIISWSGDLMPDSWFKAFLSEVGMLKHYRGFVMGLVDTNAIVYYILFIAFFLYLTLKSIEKRNR